MIILGVDPGLTTGVALYDNEYKKFIDIFELKTVRTQLQSSEVLRFLDTYDGLPVEAIAIENYIQRPNFARKENQHTFWTDQTTAKIIGIFCAYSYKWGTTYCEQEPMIKPVGYKLAGLRYVPGKKGTHITDAMAHAVYYSHSLRKHGDTNTK